MLLVQYKLAPSLSMLPLTGVVTKVPAGILNGESVVVPVAKVSIPVSVPPVVCRAPVIRESFPAAKVVAVVPCKLAIVTSVGAAAPPVTFPFKVFAGIFASSVFDITPLAIVKAPVLDIVASPLTLMGTY
ncbi:hypothetical protein D3C72_1043560 [compost metagenome]